MGISHASEEPPAAAIVGELARARRVAEALTSAGDRAIVEDYIRELSAHPVIVAQGDVPAWGGS